MVHSPTEDLFNPQQWEHWAMIFILALGLVVGYGQAAAEDKRRAQRRRGMAGRGPERKGTRRLRRRPNPQQMQAIAPKLQRSSPGKVAAVRPSPLRPSQKTRLPSPRQTAAPRRNSTPPVTSTRQRPRP